MYAQIQEYSDLRGNLKLLGGEKEIVKGSNVNMKFHGILAHSKKCFKGVYSTNGNTNKGFT